ncbi:uncharacterized protein BJ171DRAFT_493980 [Polychytrium aggregatum]|uniref:uncharacterized protein n=1 Tax=Polychytrium aggregatum TaxID=110093 RepID=UPI0022FF06C1|nr:uncharacterized protein BJ171DRAFT_493980 [Polychytrium aggregatum]KAI9207242.1 hypothetical protein BJ171DRAFT_493980 [Polychytrium aggregatum]
MSHKHTSDHSSEESPQPAKKTRIKRACDACRSKRNKCSGESPCQPCQANGIMCTYFTPQKRRGPPPRHARISNSSFPYPGSYSQADVSGIAADRSSMLAVDWSTDPFSPFSPFERNKPMLCAIHNSNDNSTIFYGGTAIGGAVSMNRMPRNSLGVIDLFVSCRTTTCSYISQIDSMPFDRIMTRKILDTYFEHIAPFQDMIDEASFFEEFDKDLHSEPFSLLLTTMCLAVIMEATLHKELGFSDINAARSKVADRSYAKISKLYDHPHIMVLQSLILMCGISALPGKIIKLKGPYYLGLAWAMAMELGLHINIDSMRNPPLNSVSRRAYRATFLCLYMYDRFSSLVTGRPVVINDDAWDDSILEEQFDERYSDLVTYVRLCRISGRLTNLIISPISTSAEQRCRATEIVNQLQDWWESVPPKYKPKPQGRFVIHHHLHSLYHSLNILSQRLVSSVTSQSSIESARCIVAYLRSIPRLLSFPNLPNPDCNYQLPCISYFAMTAATLLLELILNSPTHLEALSDLNEILITLEHLGTALALLLRRTIFECIQWNTLYLRAISGAAATGVVLDSLTLNNLTQTYQSIIDSTSSNRGKRAIGSMVVPSAPPPDVLASPAPERPRTMRELSQTPSLSNSEASTITPSPNLPMTNQFDFADLLRPTDFDSNPVVRM